MKTPLMIQPSDKHRVPPESIIDPSLIMAESERSYPIRDFLRKHFPEYCRTHQVNEEKRKIMYSMMDCRTGALGYSMLTCEICGKKQYYPCSCGSRYCPSCGTLKQMQWAAGQNEYLIPGIPYFHLVFTLPHELNSLIYQNQSLMLNILFSSAKDTILRLSMSKQKFIPGILMVLHTFGSNLSLHYHLHVLVSGGGLTKDHEKFKKCMSNKFFLPLPSMTELYRGKFMAACKELRRQDKLQYLNDAEKYRNTYEWNSLLDICYGKEWNIEVRRFMGPESQHSAETFAPYVCRKMIQDRQIHVEDGPKSSDPSAETVIQYFSTYSNCSAINDDRIKAVENGTISFEYKQYSNKSYEKKIMTLSAEEFIRRYLMHILPKGFQKIRSAGFLAGSVRKKNLILIHTLLSIPYVSTDIRKMNAVELIQFFFKEDIRKCSECRNKVQSASPPDAKPPDNSSPGN